MGQARTFRSALVLCAVLAGPAGAHAQVVTAQYDNARSGADTHETALTPVNVNPARFGRLFALAVDGDVYAQPLFLPAVAVRGRGRHDLLFVATENDDVYAFDVHARAQRAGGGPAPFWRARLADAGRGITPVPSDDVECPFIRPSVGISSTPVIDAATGTIYVLARTKERAPGAAGPRYVQRLHALDVRTGAERPGSPVEIQASVAGRGAGGSGGRVRFDPLRENPRAALLLSHGRVVLAWASSCDVGPYHGWLMAYDAHTLARLAVFNTSPDGTQSGIWQGQAGLAADARGDVFAATGNGTFSVGGGGQDWGDSVLRLRLEGARFAVKDYFTPHDERRLDEQDLDLGSGGPVLLERSGDKPHLLVVGGKGKVLYVLDRDHMGGFHERADDPSVEALPAEGMVFGAPACWNGHLYWRCSDDVLRDYRIEAGRPALKLARKTAAGFADPGAIPVVSANGARDGIVWEIETRSGHSADRPAVLHAYDAADVSRELYTSERDAARDRAGRALRFTIPTVAGGRVYVPAGGEVDVYGLLAGRPPAR